MNCNNFYQQSKTSKVCVGQCAAMRRNAIRHIIEIATQAIEDSQGIGAIPAAERLYQFRISLKLSKPEIWRRIQVKRCTLDKLHEHIQTAMGWTNSHLHQFQINGERYGDPQLLDDGFEDDVFIDSTDLKIDQILPKSGKRFRFEYDPTIAILPNYEKELRPFLNELHELRWIELGKIVHFTRARQFELNLRFVGVASHLR